MFFGGFTRNAYCSPKSNIIFNISDEAVKEATEEGASDGDSDKRREHQAEGGVGQADAGKTGSRSQCVRPGRDDRRHRSHQGKGIQG